MRALENRKIVGMPYGLPGLCGRSGGAGPGRLGHWFLLIFLGCMPGFPAASAPDDSLVLYEIITAEHEKALKRLETLRFEYTRTMEEFRRVDDQALRVLTTVTGAEESREGQLFCDVAFAHKFPDGNPRGFEEAWAKRLVVNKQQVASWNVGSHRADSWEVPVASEAARIVDRQFLTLRCPLLIKAYGDDNMTLSEFKNYLKRHNNWRVTVETREDGDDTLYVVTQYADAAKEKPYKQLTLSGHQGFMVREITHFTEGGAVYQKTQVTPKEIAPGVWFPMHYETVGYATEGEGGESDPVKVDYRSGCEVHTVTLAPEAPAHGFGLEALGVADGQGFNLHQSSGKNEAQVFFQGELLPPDVYREFVALQSEP